jgi:uncharacterized protein
MLTGACICASATAACPEPTPLTKEDTQAAKDRGFLWRIEKGGHSSYLYGTAHTLKKQWAYPGPKTLRAIEESESVALEHLIPNSDPRNQPIQPQPVSYSRVLPAALLQRIDRLAADNCLSIEQLRPMPPEGRVHALVKGSEKKVGLHPEYGFEEGLVGHAKKNKKPLESLEDLRSAQSAHRPEQTREDFLEAFESEVADLENPAVIQARLKLAEAWANRDEATIASFRSWCQCMRNARQIDFYKRLLDDRNLVMAAGLDKIHTRGTRVFAGAGALHMFGPNAMPKLMAQRGYRVERVF